ncbi:hypothetical protein BDZ85DRAFT_266513 [Elsinoe ampelina]|uniref:Uncharacterized protein n=1 Tax=Elsinoe ampelina TaxID=302913 RepID=A0A6A6G4C0_9PEZI|nr:hypothetical protein BDZ85DRAFT_266513 [Elsinoe ampelina]
MCLCCLSWLRIWSILITLHDEAIVHGYRHESWDSMGIILELVVAVCRVSKVMYFALSRLRFYPQKCSQVIFRPWSKDR